MRGISTELLFDYLATEKGFKVLRPVFDDGYDRVVDAGGRLSRVQIKSCGLKVGNGYQVSVERRKAADYNTKFDYYAIYLKQQCVWVIVPARELKGQTVKITLSGKYSKYFNNWDVLR